MYIITFRLFFHLQIDEKVISVMSDEELEPYIYNYGDRVAVKMYCKQLGEPTSSHSKKRKLVDRVIDRLKNDDDLQLDRKNTERERRSLKQKGNRNAVKGTKKIELGWFNYDAKCKEFKQVKNAKGGGTREVYEDVNSNIDTVLTRAKGLFFDEGTSLLGNLNDFDFGMMGSDRKVLNGQMTINEVYTKIKATKLRLYMSTTEVSKAQDKDPVDNQQHGQMNEATSESVCTVISDENNVEVELVASGTLGNRHPDTLESLLQEIGIPTTGSSLYTTDIFTNDNETSQGFPADLSDMDVSELPDTSVAGDRNVSVVHGKDTVVGKHQDTSKADTEDTTEVNQNDTHVADTNTTQDTSVAESQNTIIINRHDTSLSSTANTIAGSRADTSVADSRASYETDVFGHVRLPDLDDSVQFGPIEGTDCVVRIHRAFILEEMVSLYKNSDIMHIPMKFQIVDEKGFDAQGVSRDIYTCFWKEFSLRRTDGEFARVPVLVSSYAEDEWQSIGRILAKGYVELKIFPLYLAPALVATVIHGEHSVTPEMLMDSFLKYLAVDEQEVIQTALGGHVENNEDLEEIFTRLGSNTLPDPSNLRAQILQLAHIKLIQEPKYAIDNMSSSAKLPLLQLFPNVATINKMFDKLKPTSRKLISLLRCQPATKQEEQTLAYLKQFVRGLSPNDLAKFLRFLTGSDCVCVEYIDVIFTNIKGIQRCLVAHTCGPSVEVPTTYSSYPDFRAEVQNMLEGDCFTFSVG